MEAAKKSQEAPFLFCKLVDRRAVACTGNCFHADGMGLTVQKSCPAPQKEKSCPEIHTPCECDVTCLKLAKSSFPGLSIDHSSFDLGRVE
jgi:hypothetical protein